MTALAISSALRHWKDRKEILSQRAPQEVNPKITPFLTINNEFQQCHWGMSKRHKQAGKK